MMSTSILSTSLDVLGAGRRDLNTNLLTPSMEWPSIGTIELPTKLLERSSATMRIAYPEHTQGGKHSRNSWRSMDQGWISGPLSLVRAVLVAFGGEGAARV